MVEQGTHNPLVAGSNPAGPTTKLQSALMFSHVRALFRCCAVSVGLGWLRLILAIIGNFLSRLGVIGNRP